MKNPHANAGDARLIPGSGRFPGEGNGNPLQYSCPDNSLDRGVWWATVHVVAESDATEQLSTHTHNTPITYFRVFLTPSSADGHSGCFHVLAAVNSAAVNIGEQASFQTMVFSRYAPRRGIAESHGSCSFSFSRNLPPVLHRGCTNVHFYQQCSLPAFFISFHSFAFTENCYYSIPSLYYCGCFTFLHFFSQLLQKN